MAQKYQQKARQAPVSWDAPSVARLEGYARVAVVQIGYLPAALRDRTRSVLGDPLFDIAHPEREALLPDRWTTPPESILEEHKALRDRLRTAYIENLRAKVEAILAACRQYGVELIVFPEYSIPYELLEFMTTSAPEVVIVAGTHAVEAAGLKKNAADGENVYRRLQWPSNPYPRESVCPVLFGGKLIGLQAKLSAAKPEQEIMLPGRAWLPIEMPFDASHSKMGVLICLDFLDPDAPPYREYVTEKKLKECAFITVPSLTPHYTSGDFVARYRANAKFYHRPVLYCNIASEGGTTIYIDDEHSRRERPFPDYIGSLQSGDEGVLIADIRLSPGQLGSSTMNPQLPLLRPVAAASLVYRSIAEDARYADWLDKIGRHVAGVSDDDFDGLQNLAIVVKESNALLRAAGRSGMRKQRLSLLRSEMESALDLEWFKRLTREIVLPEHILPWETIRGALVRGAADVTRAWSQRTDADLHAFAEVAAHLRRAVKAADETLSDGGRAAVAKAEQDIRQGVVQALDPRAVDVRMRVYESIVDTALDEYAAQARAALDAGDRDTAEALFRRAMEEAERVVAGNPDNEGGRRRAATNRLQVAVCALNRQSLEEGRALLAPIDPTSFSPRERCVFAAALAGVGDLERAKSVLPSDDTALSDDDRQKLIDTRQRLTIEGGELPTDLSSSASVQGAAAEFLLEREDYAGAAAHAIRLLDGAQGDPLLTASGICILGAAFKWSIFEDPPNASFIPESAMKACVCAMDDGLERLSMDSLPVEIRTQVEYWRASYWGLVFDIGSIKHEIARKGGQVASPVGAAAPQVAHALAGQLAGEAKLDESLAALPQVEHPWMTRYQRIELMAIAGRMEMARETAVELVREFPGKAAIEYQVAALLHNARRPDEALPHAERAFRLLPGKGQRLLLAQCLFELGKTQRAWDLLEPLRDTRAPRILLLLAQVADIAAQDAAPRLWERYVASLPAEGTPRVRYAQALYKIGKREEAADIAREVLKHTPDDLRPDAIFAAANLVHFHEGLNEAARESVQRAVALLQSRFPSDARAEMSRMQLLLLIGVEDKTSTVNYELLVQAGMLEVVPLDEARARLEAHQRHAEDLVSFYRAGGLPFALLRHSNQYGALPVLVSWLRGDSSNCAAISAPAKPASEQVRSLRSIEGQTLIVSDLELLLLAHLDMLALVRERLGSGGRLFVFAETRTRILVDEGNLKGWAATNAGKSGGEVDKDAVNLADAVERFVARGIREQWMIGIEKPEVVRTLPPLRGEATLAMRQLVVEPFEELLAMRTLMEQNPLWLRVTADAWGSDYLAHPDTLQLFDWQDNKGFLELSAWNRILAERDMHLPDLVRKLMSGPRLDDKMIMLARLGFVDALDADLIVRVARRAGGLEQPNVRRGLEGVEQRLRSAHQSNGFLLLAASSAYGRTIWLAFDGRPDDPVAGAAPVSLKEERRAAYCFDEAGAQSLARTMLARAEAVGVDFRNQVLSFAVMSAAENPASFLKANADGHAVNDPESRGLAFYTFLYDEWAAGNPSRRAALGRAVVDALVFIDEMRPDGGPKGWELAPLNPAISKFKMVVRGVSFDEPELEAAAILSSCWQEDIFQQLTIDDAGGPVKIAELLAHGVSLLGHSTSIGGNERTWHYAKRIGSVPRPLKILAPVESILLRESVDPEIRERIALVWSKHQGLHDGRAHEHLRRIADKPEDRSVARQFARFTVTAPWRLVRDDPSFFLSYANRAPFSVNSRLPRIEDLRGMLSEPENGISPDGFFAEIIALRGAPGGVWRDKLTYARDLFLQAAAVPGNTVLVTLGKRLDDEGFVEEVQSAFDRLSKPEEHPIARLAGDFCFLQVAAVQKPVVQLRQGETDLRHEMPNLAARLLESVLPKPVEKEFKNIPTMTLAVVEGALLRVCKNIVETIARRSTRLSTRNLLWLTYRLFQWLVAQLERIAPDERLDGLRRIAEAALPPSGDVIDLLDPDHFDPSLFDHRLATVLYTLALSDELVRADVVRGAQVPPRVSSSAIQAHLIDLAEREPRGIASGSVLDWPMSAEIPDLALVALLRADPRALSKVSPQKRLRFLTSLPSAFGTTEAPHPNTVLARSLVMAASDIVDELTPEERMALEMGARRMDDTGPGRFCKAFAFTGLFGKYAPYLEADAREQVIEHIAAEFAPILVGRFLTAIAVIAADRLVAEAEHLAALLAEKGLAEHSHLAVIGLARVALHGPLDVRAYGRDALLALASRPEFVQDPKVEALLAHVGVGGKK